MQKECDLVECDNVLSRTIDFAVRSLYPMSNTCCHLVVCLSTMASNSNVVKLDFEYTSTVVAKLVIKIVFPRIPLIVLLRFLSNFSSLLQCHLLRPVCGSNCRYVPDPSGARCHFQSKFYSYEACAR